MKIKASKKASITKNNLMVQRLFREYQQSSNSYRFLIDEGAQSQGSQKLAYWLERNTAITLRQALLACALEKVIRIIWEAPNNKLEAAELIDLCKHEIVTKSCFSGKSTALMSNLKDELELAAWADILRIAEKSL